MNRRQFAKLTASATLLGTGSLAAAWSWDHRSYVFADNFRVIETGRIFAGAYQHPIPLRRIIDRYHIKTVISLREGADPYESQECELLQAKGVRFEKVVIPYKVSDAVRFDHIERAIRLMSDEQNQPVFVHCWAGCHRTGVVVAIYRVSRCGWSEAAAENELVEWGGTAFGTEWPRRLLHTYVSAREVAGDLDSSPR